MNAVPVIRAYMMLQGCDSEVSGYADVEERAGMVRIHLQIRGAPQDVVLRGLLVSCCADGAVLDLGLLSHESGDLQWASDGPMLLRQWDALAIAADWPSGQLLASGGIRKGAPVDISAVRRLVGQFLALPRADSRPAPLPAPEEKTPSPSRTPVFALPRLRWPGEYAHWKTYFDRLTPRAPFDAPGWRFVQVDARSDAPAEQILLGRFVEKDAVTQLCWAVPGAPHPRPAALSGYTWMPCRQGGGCWVMTRRV